MIKSDLCRGTGGWGGQQVGITTLGYLGRSFRLTMRMT